MGLIPLIHPSDGEEELPPIGAPYHNDDACSLYHKRPNKETEQLIEAMWQGVYKLVGLGGKG